MKVGKKPSEKQKADFKANRDARIKAKYPELFTPSPVKTVTPTGTPGSPVPYTVSPPLTPIKP